MLKRRMEHFMLRRINKKAPNGCWEWTSTIWPNGYGSVVGDPMGSGGLAHRVAYELWKAELPMRAAEQAMRLALTSALAVDPVATRISRDAASWGVDLSRALNTELIRQVRAKMSDGPLHAQRNQFITALTDAGERGLIDRQIKQLPCFKNVTRRDRDDCVTWTIETGYAAWKTMQLGPGHPRRALVINPIAHTGEVA